MVNKYTFIDPRRRKALASKCSRCGEIHRTELGELLCESKSTPVLWDNFEADRPKHAMSGIYLYEG